jgi:hypothetical protein
MNQSASAKPSLSLAFFTGILISAVSLLIVSKATGAIDCQSNFQCQYNLAGNGWLFATAGLIGVAAASLVVWLSSKDAEFPEAQVIVV